MNLDFCTATQLRCKSLQLLRLARTRTEPERSELVSIGTEMARQAHSLSDKPQSLIDEVSR